MQSVIYEEFENEKIAKKKSRPFQQGFENPDPEQNLVYGREIPGNSST